MFEGNGSANKSGPIGGWRSGIGDYEVAEGSDAFHLDFYGIAYAYLAHARAARGYNVAGIEGHRLRYPAYELGYVPQHIVSGAVHDGLAVDATPNTPVWTAGAGR